MNQVGVRQRADGTWIGPVGYTPPRLQPILATQNSIAHSDTIVQTPQKDSDRVAYATTLQAGTLGPVSIEKSQAMPGIVPLASGGRPSHVVHVELMSPSQESQSLGRRREGSTSRGEGLTMRCPRCGKSFVRRSHRQGLKERLLSLVYLYPFRCQVCANRFRAFQFRSRYVKRIVDRRQYARLSTRIPTTFAEDS